MNEQEYLLVIDKEPIDKALQDYFTRFYYHIVASRQLTPILLEKKMPLAILIDASILQEKPEALLELYTRYYIPIIVIGHSKQASECINLLHAGADDYVTKPIHARELHARIVAIRRRVLQGQQKVIGEREVLLFANFQLHPSSRQVFKENNELLELSVGEYELLYALVQKPHQVIDRERLSQIVKNKIHYPLDRAIDLQVSRLRQKIERDVNKPELIQTIRNQGYLFASNVTTIKERDLKP